MVRTPFLSHLFSLPCSGVCPLVSSLSVNCCDPAPGPGGFRAPWGVCPCVSLGSGKGQNCRHTNWGCDKPAEGSGSAQQRILGLFWQGLEVAAVETLLLQECFPWTGVERGAEGPGDNLGMYKCPCVPGSEPRAGNIHWCQGRSPNPVPGVSIPSLRIFLPLERPQSCCWAQPGWDRGAAPLAPRA